MTRAWLLIVTIVTGLVATGAHAETLTFQIPLIVTEVAGDVAFVDVGADGDLKPGMPVMLTPERGHPIVVEVNAKTAAVKLGGVTVRVGEAALAFRERPPRALRLADNTGQWPDAVRPATTDTPTPIALRADDDDRRVALAIIGHAFGAVGQGERSGDGELRVIGAFELLRERPLGADLDASVRAYAQGYDGTHAPLLVHAAALRYGDAHAPALAVGRLHYAASALGMLDGGRASLSAGKFELAAFGGLVPDPIDGRPETHATRFGTELVYDDVASVYRPRLAISAHASTWRGELDERRLNVTSSAVFGGTWANAWTEVQQFSKDNPFGASAVEVVGAGASAEWRRRDAHLGVDVTYLVPERSLKLAELLPAWVCTRVPAPGAATEACTGEDRLVASTASGGVRGDAWAIDAAASIASTRESTASVGGSGYLRGELRRGITRVHATASGGHAGFGDWASGELGVAVAPSRTFDVALAYRPERLAETPTAPVIVHAILADLHATITPSFDVGVFVLGAFGADREVLAALATFAWRR